MRIICTSIHFIIIIYYLSIDALFVVGIYTSLICLNLTVKTLRGANIYHCNKKPRATGFEYFIWFMNSSYILYKRNVSQKQRSLNPCKCIITSVAPLYTK